MQKDRELYSEEVEQNILGCMLVYEDSKRYIKLIEEDDFALIKNKDIFKLIKQLNDENKPIDIISVKELGKSNNLNSKEIFKYVIEISERVVTSANLEYCIRQLKNYSTRRKIVEKSKEIISNMYEIGSDEEANEIKKDVIQIITDIKAEAVEKKEANMKDVIVETVADIENKYLKRDDLRYMTGLFDLDKVTNGLHEQELTLIAARPRLWKNGISFKYSRTYCKKRCIYIFCEFRNVKKAVR